MRALAFGVLPHGGPLLVQRLRLEGEADHAVLAVHADDLELQLLPFRHALAGVLHAADADFRRLQHPHHVLRQPNARLLRPDAFDHALDQSAPVVDGYEVGEGILVKLLDAERDALPFGVHGKNDDLHLLALAVAAHRFLAGFAPGNVGQVNQPVDGAVQTHEDAEIGDGLDLAADAVPLGVIGGELVPGVGAALLYAQGNAAAALVDVEHHDLHLVADVHHLGRVDVLVGPVHFGNMDKALDALLYFREAAVVGEVGDGGEDPGAYRVAAGQLHPRVVPQLLHAQAHAAFLPVELEDADVHLVADIHHFAWMADAPPSHVGDVQQAVNAAEIDEGAVVGQVLDDALEVLALLQGGQQRLPLLAVLPLQHGAPGDDHVVALLVQLDDAELQWLALQMGGVAQGPDIDQGAGQKGANLLDVHRKAALDLAVDGAGDDFGVFKGVLQRLPSLRPFGLLPRQAGFAPAVVHHLQRHLDLVAQGQGERAVLVEELALGNDAFGLQAGVDYDRFVVDIDHRAGDDGAGRHVDGG